MSLPFALPAQSACQELTAKLDRPPRRAHDRPELASFPSTPGSEFVHKSNRIIEIHRISSWLRFETFSPWMTHFPFADSVRGTPVGCVSLRLHAPTLPGWREEPDSPERTLREYEDRDRASESDGRFLPGSPLSVAEPWNILDVGWLPHVKPLGQRCRPSSHGFGRTRVVHLTDHGGGRERLARRDGARCGRNRSRSGNAEGVMSETTIITGRPYAGRLAPPGTPRSAKSSPTPCSLSNCSV